MKKKIFVLIFLLLLIASVSAETISFEGWLHNTKNFDFDGILYKVLISNNGNTLILNSQISISLDLNQCYSKDFKNFCYNISTYDNDLNNYKAYVYIYYLQPEIEIERDVVNNLMEVGETAEFTTTIENIGEEDAKNIEFLEDFPDNVEISRVRNAELKGNSVYWKGNLDSGESRTITYNVKSLGKIDQYLKASVKYFDGFEEKEVFSNQVRLYSTPILTITLATDKEDYQLDEEIDFVLTLKNTGESDIDVNELNIIIPENIIVNKKGTAVEKSGTIYKWDGTLEDNETKTFNFELSAKNIGLSFIVVNGEYEYKNINHDILNTQHGFLIHNEGIEITSSLDTVEYVNSNEVKRIYVKVKNENSFSNINNLDFRTTTELPGFENQTYGSIGTNGTIFVLDTELRMPDLDAERSYKLKFNLSYETDDGDLFSEILERTIVVRPMQKIIITSSFSSLNVNEKETVTVNIRANNPSSLDYYSIGLSTKIPELFTIKGATSTYFNLNNSEEKEVLSFSLIPGLVNQVTEKNISFNIIYTKDNKEYNTNEFKTITINPIIPDISIDKTVTKSSLYQGELFRVSYIITNNDLYPIYNLKLQLTQDQNFDILNIFSYNYSRLDPGESLVFNDEELRAKKLGTFSVKESILYFKDKNERVFNKSTNLPQVTVEESHIEGPCIFVEQNTSPEAKYGEPFFVKYTILNLGNELTTINKETINDVLIFNEEKIAYLEGDFTIPKKYYEYDYLGNTARAYSNELIIKVIKESNTTKDIQNTEELEEKDIVLEENNQTVEEKKSFFGSIYSWFKNLFKKRG